QADGTGRARADPRDAVGGGIRGRRARSAGGYASEADSRPDLRARPGARDGAAAGASEAGSGKGNGRRGKLALDAVDRGPHRSLQRQCGSGADLCFRPRERRRQQSIRGTLTTPQGDTLPSALELQQGGRGKWYLQVAWVEIPEYRIMEVALERARRLRS